MKRVKYIFYVAVSLSADQLDLVCGKDRAAFG